MVAFIGETMYTNQESYVWVARAGEKHLPPGSLSFPFRFQLPAGCPPTFEGEPRPNSL